MKGVIVLGIFILEKVFEFGTTLSQLLFFLIWKLSLYFKSFFKNKFKLNPTSLEFENFFGIKKKVQVYVNGRGDLTYSTRRVWV